MSLPRLSLNQATTETTPTLAALDACAAAGIGAIALWRHKFVDGDVAATARAVAEAGLVVSSLCRGGFFTGTRPARETRDDNLLAVEEAATLGAPHLVLVCGPAVDGDIRAAEAAVLRGIEAMLPAAEAAGVTLAVEPFHPMFLAERSAVVTLHQAVDIVERLGAPGVRIALDTYHVWWDPNLLDALDRARGLVGLVHVADWLVPTPDLLAGRGLPGDGVIPLASLLREIELRSGFGGTVEVEVLNRTVWDRPAHAVARDVVARMEPLLATGGGSAP